MWYYVLPLSGMDVWSETSEDKTYQKQVYTCLSIELYYLSLRKARIVREEEISNIAILLKLRLLEQNLVLEYRLCVQKLNID